MSISTELERLKALHADGTLTDAEFEAAKARLLSQDRPARADRGSLSWALWALVVVAFLGAAGIIVVLDQASQSLRVAAGAAALAAGTLGGILSVMEDFSGVAIGGLGLGAVAIAAIAFTGAGPVLLLGVVAVLAVGAAVSWFGDLFG